MKSSENSLEMVQYSKNNCDSSKASLKYHCKGSASNSTLTNTEGVSKLKSKLVYKKAHDKISISSLKKFQASKLTANMSLISSMKELSINSEESSIIDKL